MASSPQEAKERRAAVERRQRQQQRKERDVGMELKEAYELQAFHSVDYKIVPRKSRRGLPCPGQPVAELDLSSGLCSEPGTLSSTQSRVGERNRETELPEYDLGPDYRPTVAIHTFYNRSLRNPKSWLSD